jgi:hypothetical protein
MVRKEATMTIAVRAKPEEKSLEIQVSEKLSKEDYVSFVPEVERLIERHGKIRILFEMRDFHGWELGALWEDSKFDLKHFADIERLAMVGDKKWEEWMAKFCRPFTSAKIQYFPVGELDQARNWLSSEE